MCGTVFIDKDIKKKKKGKKATTNSFACIYNVFISKWNFAKESFGIEKFYHKNVLELLCPI